MKKSTKRKLKRIKSRVKNATLKTIFTITACLFIFSVTAIDTEYANIFLIIMIATGILLTFFAYANKDYQLKEN